MVNGVFDDEVKERWQWVERVEVAGAME